LRLIYPLAPDKKGLNLPDLRNSVFLFAYITVSRMVLMSSSMYKLLYYLFTQLSEKLEIPTYKYFKINTTAVRLHKFLTL